MTLATKAALATGIHLRGSCSELTFKTDAEGLAAEVRTVRLTMTSITFSDLPDYQRLYGDPGVVDVAGLGVTHLWRQRLGAEAATAVVKGYVPSANDLVALLGGSPLETITATARPDHPASCRILEGMGFALVGEVGKFGFTHHQYLLRV